MRIVFFDCDGTLTDVKSSWQYLHERLGLWDELADAFQSRFRAGEIDYEEFCRRDAELWKGLPAETVRGILREIGFQPGVKETVGALREMGIETVILSTGLSFLVDRIRKELGITLAIANELIVEEGLLSGRIRINVQHDDRECSRCAPEPSGLTPESSKHCSSSALGRPSQRGNGPVGRGLHKGCWVRSVLEAKGIERSEAAAVGDGEGDLAMFRAVGVSIGYHPAERITPALDHALYNGSFREVLDIVRAYE